ncbi:H-NS histone family protein [Burkholderia sp. Ac-20345]|uniref:H-NS histone family protein n=1 Tax=Burkholderia sp. Ac-20345 TaxID=2703891 RepID=UPI00197B52E4|nr:H-NS histone family protein [Burkholderia sp. Ac-20345]MBN3780423.1 H-NS histone family protein [Burkholderia sp. Ac-20345]
MASYRTLLSELEVVAIQAEVARLAELQVVVEDIREKVVLYGITSADIFPRPGRRRNGGRSPSGKTELPPKYRNPETGATWCGRGRRPRWLAGAENIDKFVID